MRTLFLVPLSLALGGCVVGTLAGAAVDVVTLPVKVAAAGVDTVTTSQAEADEQRGRELRRQEEARGRQLRIVEQRCRARTALPTDDCNAVPRR